MIKKMLINPNEKFTKKSSKKVDHFIKNENEDKKKSSLWKKWINY